MPSARRLAHILYFRYRSSHPLRRFRPFIAAAIHFAIRHLAVIYFRHFRHIFAIVCL